MAIPPQKPSFPAAYLGVLQTRPLAITARSDTPVTVNPNLRERPIPTHGTPARDTRRASRIIGSTVYGPDDKSIGDVHDLIIERDGRVSQAVLSVGGFLGIGEKHVAVPIGELKYGKDGHPTVNLTKVQLQQAPKFEYA